MCEQTEGSMPRQLEGFAVAAMKNEPHRILKNDEIFSMAALRLSTLISDCPPLPLRAAGLA